MHVLEGLPDRWRLFLAIRRIELPRISPVPLGTEQTERFIQDAITQRLLVHHIASGKLETLPLRHGLAVGIGFVVGPVSLLHGGAVLGRLSRIEASGISEGVAYEKGTFRNERMREWPPCDSVHKGHAGIFALAPQLLGGWHID